MSNQGWLFTGAHEPLVLSDVPAPIAGRGEVVLNVAAAGLCHSDIGIIEGPGAAWITNLPIVLGHEVAGTIREIGPGVDGFAVGDRVAIGLLAHGDDKKTGWDAPGLSRNGGYEQLAIAQATELVHIPDRISFAQAAAATDSVTTAYHAVVAEGGVCAGTVVGIIGMGGLGLNAVQIADAAGAEVHGVDTSEGARNRASEFGIASVHADAGDLAQFQPEVIFDFAGFGTTTAAAIEAVRTGGRVVLVGLGAIEATISTNLLVTKQVTLIGSSGGSKDDLKTVLGMMSNGTITNIIEEIPFDTLPEGIRRLSAGEVVGRLVLDVAGAN
jgi:alcohol dehydrogenase, propanol-preferring